MPVQLIGTSFRSSSIILQGYRYKLLHLRMFFSTTCQIQCWPQSRTSWSTHFYSSNTNLIPKKNIIFYLHDFIYVLKKWFYGNLCKIKKDIERTYSILVKHKTNGICFFFLKSILYLTDEFRKRKRFPVSYFENVSVTIGDIFDNNRRKWPRSRLYFG